MQQMPLDSPIEVLDLSVRSHNRLIAHGILTVGQLINCPISELKQIKGLGKKCLSEIRSALSKYGFELTA
jgi:DNA-directed RNA polymerase alpha subunit